jgi:hypothetical protein
LVCGGAGKGRSNCDFAGAPLDLIEKSFLSFLSDAESDSAVIDCQVQQFLQAGRVPTRVGRGRKHAARIAELILGDDEAPKLLYDRLKVEEARGKQLRRAIDAETMRLKAEAPALETYESFRKTLANKSNDKAHRPELRGGRCSLGPNNRAGPARQGWFLALHRALEGRQ